MCGWGEARKCWRRKRLEVGGGKSERRGEEEKDICGLDPVIDRVAPMDEGEVRVLYILARLGAGQDWTGQDRSRFGRLGLTTVGQGQEWHASSGER